MNWWDDLKDWVGDLGSEFWGFFKTRYGTPPPIYIEPPPQPQIGGISTTTLLMIAVVFGMLIILPKLIR